MSLSFICHPQPAAGLQPSSYSSTVSSPSSSVPSHGLKRAREEDEWSDVDVIDLTTPEYEEEESHSKRRKTQAGPQSLSSVSSNPQPEGRYVGLGISGLPTNITPSIIRRADALQASSSMGSPYRSPRHPVWKTESALRGVPSPILSYTPHAPDLVLPPLSSLLGGDFPHFPPSGAGLGLGIDMDFSPLTTGITPDEM
ncbi:hypothetical protein EUX98_g7193 [Antrodiella citrinella]|uniref:Uncharacterized protein n=1 Tax=Antrodiella citrinella TaxID=2447956 RepID=A0A4S4MM47_9APHY|nr:hypothetical protein EUX98_g7193 [Antrodiella citrinella]